MAKDSMPKGGLVRHEAQLVHTPENTTKNETRLVDISRSEQVVTDLDRLIERRDTERRRSEGERLEEELWAESVARYNARRDTENRLAWCEHFRRMRAVHWGLGDEYDAKLRDLENGHQERGDAA